VPGFVPISEDFLGNALEFELGLGQSYDDFTLDNPAATPITITAAPASVTFSAASPLIGRRFFIQSVPATVTFSVPVPKVQPVTVTAPSASVTFSGPTPTIKAKVSVAAAPLVTFSVGRPSVLVGPLRAGDLAVGNVPDEGVEEGVLRLACDRGAAVAPDEFLPLERMRDALVSARERARPENLPDH